MQRAMNEHEEIGKALKARLSELRTHLAKVDRSLRKPLPADSEDQAIELENQEALEVIEKTGTTEIHQIEAALKRISEGSYGTCAKCGEPIDPRRLKALPTAATCISCSA
jgi:DnaK suppressor protein